MAVRITRSTEFKANMGNYEHVVESMLVSIGTDDLDTDDPIQDLPAAEQVTALEELANQLISDALEPRLTEHAELSQAKDSMLFGPPPKPTQTTARRPRSS